ncbi:unnamed protein product [Arabidopsis lyrata]|uniref:uncharacterized protein LOC9328008 n=1 Tax=Arabidopsis lyrata subsp. lyrata TaxID=81972 RepID=UPI000A29B888|nr:uncharacterized protein LOC9328008 [Arabidopsis lyrata subsp. lyrata]CAH8256729.1 unnamed protein product [Arabidopsis lyrata]|eukprot:XP_020866248.1 uncharacterized protein LOC9328008 [Arabidopsis lyrata subsp. lyrata]
MGDSQKSKEKGPYNLWGPDETQVLVELLVDAVHRNWRDNSGNFSKLTVEQKILPVLNERLGCQKNHNQYLSRWKYLRTLYQNYLDLQRFNSGFGWDLEMKRFTAPDEVWDEYLKKHPKHKHLRHESNEQFEDLQLIFGCGLATSGSAIGMGETTDARTFRSGGSKRVKDNKIDDEVFELSSQEPAASPECDTPPFPGTNPKGRVEKLRPRKRSRTLATSNADKLKTDEEDPMIIVRKRLYIMEHTILREDEFQLEDDESEMDVLLLLLENTTRAYFMNRRIERPMRKPITRIGYIYIQKALKEDQEHFRQDCVGAIDGTHIHATVPASDAPSYRNRKGYTSQNVLVACNFDLEFIYVLSGWEGTAHNSKVLNDALTRSTSKLPVPEGKYYLVDCGFAIRRNFLAPYRGTKYHLQDFRGQGCDPSNQNELFNLRHASSNPVFKVQAELVLACAGLHNFLRRECRSDEFLPEEYSENIEENNENNEENTYEENGDMGILQSQQREYANNWRDTIAANMWAEATGTGSHP